MQLFVVPLEPLNIHFFLWLEIIYTKLAELAELQWPIPD